MEAELKVPVLYFACRHHTEELVCECAIEDKLGPTSGPTEKYFTRFEAYFNKLSTEEREAIRADAVSRRDNLLRAEDDVTREFMESTRAFFTAFMSQANGFQRDDYREFARMIMVIIEIK